MTNGRHIIARLSQGPMSICRAAAVGRSTSFNSRSKWSWASAKGYSRPSGASTTASGRTSCTFGGARASLARQLEWKQTAQGYHQSPDHIIQHGGREKKCTWRTLGDLKCLCSNRNPTKIWGKRGRSIMLTIYTYGQISVMTHAVGIQPALSNTPLDSTDRSVQEPLGVEYIPTRADEADMPDVPSHRPNPGTFVWISWRRGSLVSLDHMEVQLERGPHQIGNSVGARLLADEGGHLESILRVINKILP